MGDFWIGLIFKFPLISLLVEKYQPYFHLRKHDDCSWTHRLVSTQGYREEGEDTTCAYDFTVLHQQHVSVTTYEDPKHYEESA